MFYSLEADPETSTSSYLEESDSSSAQRSPSYSSEPEHAHSFTEGFTSAHMTSGIGHVTVGLSHVRKVGTATGSSSSAQASSFQVPQLNVTAPKTDTSAYSKGTVYPKSAAYPDVEDGDEDWYEAVERAPSPVPPAASPRVSPTPKALKPTTPCGKDLRIRITPAPPGGSCVTPPVVDSLPTSPTSPTRVSLRSSKNKPASSGNSTRSSLRGHGQLQQQGTGPSLPRDATPVRGQHLESSSLPHVCTTSVNQLTVPSPRISNRNRQRAGSESSSSSSHHPNSSRSATSSPKTPDSPDGAPWAIDPAKISSHYFKKQPSNQQPITGKFCGNQSPEVEPRTSSMQRPLGVAQQESSHVSSPLGQRGQSLGHSRSRGQQQQHALDCAPKWHSERWKHWEKLAKQNSEEFHEQETLV